jgi:DNA (cytosine-5)-methyltransferase 1
MAHGQGGAEVRLDGARSLTCNHEAPIVFDTTQLTHPANRSVPKPGDPCHPLAAGAHAPAVAFDARQSDVCVYGEKTGPLDTDGHTIGVCVTGDRTHTLAKSSGATEDGTGRGTPIVPTRTMAVRRLTPVECERLQGFPDGHTAIPYRGKPASDGPRYRALGNSMAVPVMRWIGERIAKVEKL